MSVNPQFESPIAGGFLRLAHRIERSQKKLQKRALKDMEALDLLTHANKQLMILLDKNRSILETILDESKKPIDVEVREI